MIKLFQRKIKYIGREKKVLRTQIITNNSAAAKFFEKKLNQ